MKIVSGFIASVGLLAARALSRSTTSALSGAPCSTALCMPASGSGAAGWGCSGCSGTMSWLFKTIEISDRSSITGFVGVGGTIGTSGSGDTTGAGATGAGGATGFGSAMSAGFGWRLASQSSKNDEPALGTGAGAGAGGAKLVLGREGAGGTPGLFAHGELKLEGPPNAGGFGGSYFVFRRSKISSSTIFFGRPYLAADSCFKASARSSFGLPSGGKVAMLNGSVGTPSTIVRTAAL